MTEQASDLDSNGARILVLSDQEFKAMIIMLRALMDKEDSMQEERSNLSRDTSRSKNHKEN